MYRTKISNAVLASILTLYLLPLAALGWLRGQDERHDDRGSDSTEKTLMIILGITVGFMVLGAIVVYINTKIPFKDVK